MDKVKIALTFVMKYGFWFITGIIVIMILISWWLSTSSLADQTAARTAVLESKFKSVQNIIADAQHPNQELIDAVTKKHTQLKNGVLSVWEVLYNEQKQKNPWPSTLGNEFLQSVQKLNFGDPIPVKPLEIYQYFIKDYVLSLFNKIDLRREKQNPKNRIGGATATTPSAYPGAYGKGGVGATSGQDKIEYEGLVVWDAADRERILQSYNWRERPSSMQVWLAQEDLWVYSALLDIIKNTNEGITEHNKANIKRIEALQIGSDAISGWSAAKNAVFQDAKQQLNITSSNYGAYTSQSTETAQTSKAMTNRYLDDKGEPMAADQPQPYAEFKMMPIRLKLYMNQSKIPDFLAECGNSAMPIEVNKVRLFPDDGKEIISLEPEADSGYSGGRSSSSSGSQSYPSYSSSGSSGSIGLQSVETELNASDIPVEILGTIYIYNHPDYATLGTGERTAPPVTETPTPDVPPTPSATLPESSAPGVPVENSPQPGVPPAGAPGA